MSRETIDSPGTPPHLPIESVAAYPLPGMVAPGGLAFSPDDRLITYLYSPDASLNRYLYAFDTESGEVSLLLTPPEDSVSEESLTLAEKLDRERRRQRELGITQYAWAEGDNRILLRQGGSIYIWLGDEKAPRRLVAGGSAVRDARFSPDGSWVAYVLDAELHVVPAIGGEPRRRTWGARESGKTNGLAEFIAQEEMGRHRGFWWSNDSRWLAFAEVDESHIPVYRIVHQGRNAMNANAQEEHHYPFAGQANARVRLGVVPVNGGEPIWMDLGENDDFYLARVKWLPDGRLSAQRLNRDQTVLDLLVFDAKTGKSDHLLREETDVWINLNDMFRPLKDGHFIWASERSGFQHLYLHAPDGELIRPLTEGSWVVDRIAGVDQRQEIVYFTGNKGNPMESQLYAASFAGGESRQITTEAGTHAVTIDRGKRRFIDVHHSLDKPPTITLRSLSDGQALAVVYASDDPRVAELGLSPPELITLQNREGIDLHGAVYRPDSSHGSGPYPTIISVYGGPHVQRVTNGWSMTVSMRAQYLRSRGYLVFVLDNRGSARRGLAFERPIRRRMGQIEVQDQMDGVSWLVGQGLADPDRMGIYGWSYGGYLALMCLAQAADTFKVAVSGAPVTHWDGYDTCYTERYMGLPQTNPQGYEESSVMRHVDKIRGRLLLVHGLIDENVHFRHTARLINALIRAGKPYDLLLFPDERHMPRRLADRIFMEQHITDYLRRHLGADISANEVG